MARTEEARRRGAGRRAALLVAAAVAMAAACGGGAHVAASPAARPSPLPTGGGAATSPAPAPSRPPTAPASPAPAPAGAVPPPAPATNAGWVGPIYAPHAHGYDVSYPQCDAVDPPAGAAFSIVGVNAGRAFTVNPCLAAEWPAAAEPRAVYVNSGYNPDNADRASPDCRTRARQADPAADRQTAYAIGCSEAQFAMAAMRAGGADAAAVIWVDVESSNSWDVSRLDLNRVALQAELDQIAALGRLVGLYGTFDEWYAIVGDWIPAGVVANWVAGQPAEQACGAPGFTGQPVWIAQELATWPGSGDDSDWAC
jgi:hypothetical protein